MTRRDDGKPFETKLVCKHCGGNIIFHSLRIDNSNTSHFYICSECGFSSNGRGSFDKACEDAKEIKIDAKG